MNKQNKPRSYQDFIENQDFILWVLTEDNAQDEFWNKYIEQNPCLEEDFNRAISTCNTIRPTGNKLNTIERDNLLYSIKESSKRTVNRKKIKLFSIYAVASTLLIIGMSVLFFSGQEKLKDRDLLFTLLESADNDIDNIEDVHIISGSNYKVISDQETLTQTQKGDILLGDNDMIKSIDLESEYITLIVPKGKRSMIKFNDGSTAWINSGSKVIYPKVFGDKSRDIVIDGEIYIDVAKVEGVPFFVHTKELDIKVLGTKFNVSAYSEEFIKSVVLVKGAVEVNYNNGKNKLSPDQGLFAASGKVSIEKVDTYKYICWKDGILQFEDESFGSLLRKLSRYYGIQIHSDPSLDNLKFEGNLNLKDSLEDVLQVLSLSKYFTYKKENNIIYINK